MWKDFLYFSKAQQVGIIVMIILILLTITVYTLLPRLFSQDTTIDPIVEQETKAFIKEIHSLDSIEFAEKEKRQAAKKVKEQEQKQRKDARENRQKRNPELFHFNPNTADSADLVRLGMHPYTASNIVKYREKGGKFRKADDLQKIHGLTEQQYKTLKPYITIPIEKEQNSSLPKKLEPKIALASIELNTADTTELMRIKGLGRFSAIAIIAFRRKSGGFYSTNQLDEIKTIQAENLKEIKPYLSANGDLIQKIKINSASVEYLKQHPYINFYQAKAIHEYRKAKGEIKSIEELKKLSEFTSSDWERLQYYFSFE